MGKFNLAEHLLPAQPAAGRDIEAITADILSAKRQVGEGLFTIGRGLIEAKALLSHGEWLPWLTDRVEFSEATAQNYMKLVRKYSNPEALRDLGYTKALMLLSLPDGSRDEYIEAAHVVDGEEKTVFDMSTRELKAALKERDAALKAAEQAKAEQSAAEQARDKLSTGMALANERIAGLNAELDEHSAKAREAQDAAARLEKELAELRARPVEVAVEVDAEAVENARKEAEAAMRARLDKAKQAQARAEEARKTAEKAKAQAEQALERVKAEAQSAAKKSAISASGELALFGVLLEQVQAELNKMGGVLRKVRETDPEKAGGLVKALLALSEKIREVAER